MQTTILGVTYEGRPMFGSFTLRVALTERVEGREAAERLVKAHAHAMFPCPCKDPKPNVWEPNPPRQLADGSHPFAADMTPCPQEGVEHVPVVAKGGHRHAHL